MRRHGQEIHMLEGGFSFETMSVQEVEMFEL